MVIYNITLTIENPVAQYSPVITNLPAIIANGSPIICINGNNGAMVDIMYMSGQTIIALFEVPAGLYVFCGSYISAN